jgi:flagellar hook-basal body complex protein FliE
MSVSGVEAIGAALPSMPSMPSMAGTATTAADPSGATAAASGTAGAAGVQAPTGPQAVGGVQSASGAEFGNLLADGLDRLQGLQNSSSNLAVKAATGDLSSIHDYTIAAAEASTATQLTVSLRNTGVQAFNQIMSMQV